jgi:hypothetical protein
MSDHEVPDPLLDEIREIREQIWRELGDDPQRVYEHYMELQKQFKGRLISRSLTPDEELAFQKGPEELRHCDPDDCDPLAGEVHEPQLRQQPSPTPSSPRRQDRPAA